MKKEGRKGSGGVVRENGEGIKGKDWGVGKEGNKDHKFH